MKQLWRNFRKRLCKKRLPRRGREENQDKRSGNFQHFLPGLLKTKKMHSFPQKNSTGYEKSVEFFCELGEKKLDRGRKRTAPGCTGCDCSVENNAIRLHNKKTIITIESFWPVRIRTGVLRTGSAYRYFYGAIATGNRLFGIRCAEHRPSSAALFGRHLPRRGSFRTHRCGGPPSPVGKV